MDTLTFSLIIPVKPGHTVTAAQRLTALDYPQDRYEVIVAEGFRPSSQRNRAVETASGELIYFLDDDSLIGTDLLTRASAHFRNPQVVAVGGPSLTPETDTLFQRSIGIALASALGGGGMRNRYRSVGTARATDDRELILCNLCFRRDVFLRLSGLDERLYPNEENELMDRIRTTGGILIHDPALAVWRSQRPDWPHLRRQFLNYGRGRAEQSLISKQLSFSSLIPALLILYLLSMPLSLEIPLVAIPLCCYVLLLILVAGGESVRSGLSGSFFRLLLILPTIHIAYGVGLWWGLLRAAGRRPVVTSLSAITLRQVKRFTDPLPATLQSTGDAHCHHNTARY